MLHRLRNNQLVYWPGYNSPLSVGTRVYHHHIVTIHYPVIECIVGWSYRPKIILHATVSFSNIIKERPLHMIYVIVICVTWHNHSHLPHIIAERETP